MAGREKTIAAISTPQAAGGIGIVRISGENARQVAQRVFHASSGKSVLAAKGYTALFGRVADQDGEFDEAVALVFAAPKSYTGEDVVELSCHGGLFLVRRLLAAVLAAGARPAGPGEFTRRAFLNGKLSLTGAEAVMDLIGAQGKQAAAAALAAKDGALGKRINGVKETILALSAHLAAWVDYPEDDIPALEPKAFQQDLADAQQELEGLLSGFDRGKVIREGVETVLAGRPNVGKSTFINKVAKKKSAKAQDRPGVTRGKQWVSVDTGLDLLDTPGILWPKFEDQEVGRKLAFTGAIKDEIMDTEVLACALMETLAERYPQALAERYHLQPEPDTRGWELLEAAGRKRGFLISGGEVDTERMDRVVLDEFRGGKLGRFTLEIPGGTEQNDRG